MADENEGFRLGALLTGPLSWRNHLKVGVFVLIFILWVCVYNQVKEWFGPKKESQPVVINSGGAPVDNSTTKKWFSFLDINFGGRDN